MTGDPRAAEAIEQINKVPTPQDHSTPGPEDKENRGTKRKPTVQESDSPPAAKASKHDSPVVQSSKNHSTFGPQDQNEATGSKRKSGTQQPDSVPAAKMPKQDSKVSHEAPPSNDMGHSPATVSKVSLLYKHSWMSDKVVMRPNVIRELWTMNAH